MIKKPGEQEARNKMIREIRRNNKKGTRLKPLVPNFSLRTTNPQHRPFNTPKPPDQL